MKIELIGFADELDMAWVWGSGVIKDNCKIFGQSNQNNHLRWGKWSRFIDKDEVWT